MVELTAKAENVTKKYYFDACGYRIMAIMSGFQPENRGSIPLTRSKRPSNTT